MKLKLRLLDFLIFAIAISLFVGSLLSLKKNNSGEKYVIVKAHHDEYIFPLNKNIRQEIKGSTGSSVIVIKDGKAYFEESCCPNKTCVASPPIKNTGEWSACLPNQVFLRIDGEDDDVDALAK